MRFFDQESIPLELRRLPQWILWKKEMVNGKYTKIPYQFDGKKAMTSNAGTFSTFSTALKSYRENNFFDGIGFVFTKEDPYIGIDIDDCVYYHAEDVKKLRPKYTDLAVEIIDSLDSYCELSQSKNGVHIIVKGDLPSHILGTGRKNPDIGLEIYSSNRYFAITGDRENDNGIEERTDELNEIFEKYFKDSTSTQTNVLLENYQNDEIKLSNSELWNKMFQSRSGSEIKALYDGELINNDHSSSDLSLCNHLAFWTGKSASRIDSMFRESGLMREKWDLKRGAELYGEMTIARAISSTTATILDYESTDNFKVKFDFSKKIAEKDLEKVLKERHWDEIQKLKKEWELNDRKGREPMALAPKMCANLLQQYIKFIVFDLEENTRLAMYVASEGIYTSNTQYIKRVISWIEPTLTDSKANDVIYHLTNDAEVKPRTDSRFLIAVQNGIFNLKTKELEDFTPDYVFTSKISTPYVSDPYLKVIDGWSVDAWIKSLACFDEQIEILLWQVINDSLNGNYTRKKAIFLLGDGNNGKGTFQDLLINLIGAQNVATLRIEEFKNRFSLSMLEGKTVVIGDDVQSGIAIEDSANFNSVVTGDRVGVEQKNKPKYSAVFRCSVIQSTNGMPQFKNKTSGTMRRLLIVPFNADFNGEKENFKIKEEYIKDPEVLQYVLHRAINMDFERFSIPDLSLQQLDEFELDNNPVTEFYRDCFREFKHNEIPMSVVYSTYVIFCKQNGYKELTSRMFHKEFKKIAGDKIQEYAKRFSIQELEKISEYAYIPNINNISKVTNKCYRKNINVV